MKKIYIYITLLFVFFMSANDALTKEKFSVKPASYFPVNNNITLVYNSSFGETIATYIQNGKYTIHTSKADKFKYKQTMIIKEDGVYITETYQYLKVLLFIKKEGTFTYGKPLLRFPLPLLPGMIWEWQGVEYSDGDSNKVKVTGSVLDKEFVNTKARKFEAIKLESLVEGPKSKNRVTEWFVEGIGLIKAKIIIEGGGTMGVLRDLLGYGTIEFELTEIRKN